MSISRRLSTKIVLGIALLASGCNSSSQNGPAEIEQIERSRLTKLFPLDSARVHAVVIEDYGLVTTEPGEKGFITSIYHDGWNGWRWVKQKPGKIESCLFEAADASREEADRLTAAMIRKVPRLATDAGSMPCATETR